MYKPRGLKAELAAPTGSARPDFFPQKEKSKEPRPQGGALEPKFLNQKTRSRNKFGMTKKQEPNRYVMLNLGLMKIRLVSASIFYLTQ